MSERKYIYLILGIIGIFCVIYFSNTTQKFGANPRVLLPIQGGTGVAGIPTNGQILIGDGSGNYIVDDFSTYDTGGGGTGSNWNWYSDQTYIKPSTSVGIFVTASSTFNSDLRVNGYFRATSALDFWFNNTTTWTGFDTNWDRMFNATTTWSAFTANFNTLLNATSTLDLTTLVTDKTTSTIGLWVGTAGNPIFSNETGGDIFAQDDIEAGGGLFASDISTTTATTTLAGESGGGGVKIYHIDGTTTIEFL